MAVLTSRLHEARRATGDVAALISFRTSGLRGRSRRNTVVVSVVFAVLTLAAAVVPAFTPGHAISAKAQDLVLLLPTIYLAFIITTTFSIIGAGGGRELLPRDEGVAFPVSPTTDHLGALLLAPLNIAWMIQAWTVLGLTSYASGPTNLWAVQLVAVLWMLAATAVAQAIAWVVEWTRRRDHGIAIVRGVGLAIAAVVVTLVARHEVTRALDHSPTVRVVIAAFRGQAGRWLQYIPAVAILAATFVVAVIVGARLNHAVARRQPREELKESGRSVTPRPMPASDSAMLLRIDRASVWRSVPLRRGLVVLALLPGLVATAGRLDWEMLPILPGLVAAGGALLFGVNAWCLDATGALWRDSLPVEPEKVFYARVRVLVEILLLATGVSVVVASLRASGTPTSAELTSLLVATVVVSLQVVARSMHWSVRRPFAMDLRSSRGTPAPPSAMVAYSSYLALTSTLTGMVFTLTARADDPRWAFVWALPFVIAAVRRLVITAGDWARPEVRSWVVATVAAR
ncbi:MAG: hypothetical protein WAK18_09340 [Nocardioidaceae bacterium]